MITIAAVDPTMDASLLNVMSKKANYIQYSQFINNKVLLEPTTILLKNYKKYFDLYPDHEKINFETFYTQFSQNWEVNELSSEDLLYFRDYVIPAAKHTADDDSEACLLGFIDKQTIKECETVFSTSFDLIKLRELLDTHEKKRNEIIKNNDTEICTISTVDFNVLDKSEGISWWLPTLQEGIGSLVKGQLVVIAADVNTGKSAAIISQVAHTLEFLRKKDNGPILYFNSEGTNADVFGRICSNLFRDTVRGGFEEIVERREEVREQFLRRYGDDKLFVVQITARNTGWMTSKIIKYKPSLVIVDIADSLAADDTTANLKKVYDELRIISGNYCPVIATTQAGNQTYYDKDTGLETNKRWIGDKGLYGSKTGKGGAADTLITIGKDDNLSNTRYLSVPKKKRGKSVDITCELIEEYSLYKELAW